MGAPQRNRPPSPRGCPCQPRPATHPRAHFIRVIRSVCVALSRQWRGHRYEEAIAKYSEAIGLMKDLDPDDDDEIEAGGRHLQ